MICVRSTTEPLDGLLPPRGRLQGPRTFWQTRLSQSHTPLTYKLRLDQAGGSARLKVAMQDSLVVP
jgi:hypothetical protein